jgi:hypothetical protein
LHHKEPNAEVPSQFHLLLPGQGPYGALFFSIFFI